MSTDPSNPLSEAEQFAAHLEQARQDGYDIPATDPAKADPEPEPAAEVVEPAPEAAPAGDDKPADPPQEPAGDEPFPGFNALPEDTRKAITARLDAEAQQRADMERRWKAQVGQLAPTQQALERERLARGELQRKIEQFEAKGSTANKEQLTSALDKFRAYYPDEAGVFDALAKELADTTAKLSEKNLALESEVRAARETVEHWNQLQILERAHPDRLEIVQSDEWKAWVAACEPELQQYFKTGDAQQAAYVLSQFKRDRELANLVRERESQAAQPQHQQQPPAAQKRKPEPAPNPTTRRPIAGRPANGISSPEADEWQRQIAEARADGYS